MIHTTNVVWYGEISVQFLFCLYLVWTRLGRDFPTFTSCLACAVLRSVAAIYFMRGAVGALLPLSYTYFWLWSQPVWLLLLIAVALEVHRKIWKDQASVVRQTRPLLLVALLVAVTFAALPLRYSEANQTASSRLIALMHFEIQATQYISSVLAVFLLLSAVIYFTTIHDAWQKSIWRHEGMLAVYFGVYATASFIIELDWFRTPLVNGYIAAALTLCFVAWITIFQPHEVSNS